jgi:glutathione synthase/RimK-type ligase-like ATP-grasp enzyme
LSARSDLVVLIGDDDDPHVVAVGAALERRGVAQVTIGVNANFGLVAAMLAGDRVAPVLRLDGAMVPLDDVVGVLDRGRSSVPVLTDERWQYVFRERKAFLEALPALARRARWLNDPAAAVCASNKVAQLLAAQRAGFRVPPTYVTNDVEVIRELLADTGGDIVFKALTWLATVDGRVLFTNRLEPSVPEEFAAALRPAPVIFQERVRKRDELRVTCIGERSFGVRIVSQERPDTALDWRRNQEDVGYEAALLPQALEDRLHAVMADLGISFGAFDLARDDDGEVVFFEVNPTGNWLWLEERLDLPISEAVADWLARAVDDRL